MVYSNSQILSAVLTRFLQPVIQMYGGDKFASLPAIRVIENKVKSMGIVSGNWSLMKELSPLVENVSGKLVTPILNNYLSKMDDVQLPYIAHSIVDSALKNGELSLLEGTIEIEEADLKELKRLLNINLPLKTEDVYIVKEAEEMEEKNG